jgi:hypothetical protein
MVFGDKPQPLIIVQNVHTVEGHQPHPMHVADYPALSNAPPAYK